jgi:hypothetical protein
MTKLGDIPASHDPVHLLLIADSKMGKSVYGAQAVVDGWRMIYVDADNGLSAMRYVFKGNREYEDRVLYFRTNHPCKFIEDMLTSSIFRWNITQDEKFTSSKAIDSDEIVEMWPEKFPRNFILNIDSWTSVALDAMGISAADRKTTIEDMDEYNSEGVYGGASRKLTLLCAILQHVKFHVIVQAHGVWYERLEKKPGNVKESSKRNEMQIKETVKVPQSSSKPHGYSMGKYFNQIGWIELDPASRRQLDFKVEVGRLGGGTPDKREALKEMEFAKLFGKPESYGDSPWPDPAAIRYSTFAEWKSRQESTAPKPTGVTAVGTIAKTPAQQTVSAMLKKPTTPNSNQQQTAK